MSRKQPSYSAASLQPTGYTLRGLRLTMERIGPQHADYLQESLQQEDFWRNYRANQPRRLSREQLRSALRQEYQAQPEKIRKLEWVIFNGIKNADSRSGDKQPIGLACLADFAPKGKKAELLVGIQNPAQRAHGKALEATLLLMDFAFNRAGLNKLVSYVYAQNQTAQDNTLALGFIQEGLLREHVYDQPNDSYIDVFQNGLLRREFRTNARLARLSKRLLGRDVTQAGAVPAAKKATHSVWTINTRLDY